MMRIKFALRRTFVDFPVWVVKLAMMMLITGTVFYALVYAHLYFQGGICR